MENGIWDISIVLKNISNENRLLISTDCDLVHLLRKKYKCEIDSFDEHFVGYAKDNLIKKD